MALLQYRGPKSAKRVMIDRSVYLFRGEKKLCLVDDARHVTILCGYRGGDGSASKPLFVAVKSEEAARVPRPVKGAPPEGGWATEWDKPEIGEIKIHHLEQLSRTEAGRRVLAALPESAKRQRVKY